MLSKWFETSQELKHITPKYRINHSTMPSIVNYNKNSSKILMQPQSQLCYIHCCPANVAEFGKISCQQYISAVLAEISQQLRMHYIKGSNKGNKIASNTRY